MRRRAGPPDPPDQAQSATGNGDSAAPVDRGLIISRLRGQFCNAGTVVLTLETRAPYHPVRSMPRWLTDWLQDHPTAVAVLAPVGASLCSVGLRYATNRWSIAGFIALI